MTKRKDFTVTDEQVKQLTQAIKRDKRADVVRRATAVHLLYKGEHVADVAETLSASKPIIYAWHECFLAGGVERAGGQAEAETQAQGDPCVHPGTRRNI